MNGWINELMNENLMNEWMNNKNKWIWMNENIILM